MDIIPTGLLWFTSSGFDYQDIGKYSEEGDDDKGPDFERRLAGLGLRPDTFRAKIYVGFCRRGRSTVLMKDSQRGVDAE